MITILHNPRCGKSRECMVFAEESNQEIVVRKYLDNPLTYQEIKDLIKLLNIKPVELVRQKEKIWIENYKGKLLTDDEIINAMAENPILIERPIVIKENKAVIARPAEKIFELI